MRCTGSPHAGSWRYRQMFGCGPLTGGARRVASLRAIVEVPLQLRCAGDIRATVAGILSAWDVADLVDDAV